MIKLFRQIINFIIPPRCINCGKLLNGADGVCSDCFSKLVFISKPYCKKCGRPFSSAPDSKNLVCAKCLNDKKSPFRLMRSAYIYDDFSKKMILDFKFFDKTDNAKILAKWLKSAGKDIFDNGVDVIVPIPLHYTRLIKRRYNQSALLAKELSKLTGIKVDYTAVIKHKNTKPQVEFSGRAREKNVKGVFSVKNVKKIQNKRVLLIDDVLTTGSTLKECALAIKAADALSIDALSLARVV